MVSGWTVHDSMNDVDAEEWNDVVIRAGGSVFHSHQWLTAYETAPPAPLFHARHFCHRTDGRLDAVAPFYEVQEDPHYVGYGPDYDFDHPILHTRMLVGHSWYSYFNGVCSVIDPAEIVDDLVGAVGEVATHLGVSVFGFPGVPESDSLGSELEKRGFSPVYTEATSGVDFAGTAQAHLDTLRSQKFRREFRRLSTKALRSGAHIRTTIESGDVERFAKLVEDVCARHGVATINPPESLYSIFENLREYVYFVSIWLKDELLGGFVLMHFEDTLYAWIAGLNYDHHKELGTYYALYAQTLQLAERLGVKRIEMGRSMYGFKVRMGFHPQPLVSWFTGVGPDGRELVREGIASLDQHCRTRSRIAEAYESNKLEIPEMFTGPPRFAVGGA